MISVVTGDVILSRKVNIHSLLDELKGIFNEITKKTQINFSVEFYRGDSFQIVIDDPKDALLFSILLRTGLKSKTDQESKLNGILWDARVSIGIGQGEVYSKIVESNGEAFILSGLEFDKLKKLNLKLSIRTNSEENNKSFTIIVQFIDILINKYSKSTSEVVYLHFLKGINQSEMANELNISQPAINKRLKIANIKII